MARLTRRNHSWHGATAVALAILIVLSPLPAPLISATHGDVGSFSQTAVSDSSVSSASAGQSLPSKDLVGATPSLRGLRASETATAEAALPAPMQTPIPPAPNSPPSPIPELPPLPNILPPPDTREEIVERRTENAKFFRETDGRTTAEFYSGPIHFLTPQGAWEEIDTTIVPSTRTGYAFRNRQGAFTVDFAASAGVPDAVSLESEAGTVSFTPVGANPLSIAQAEGSRVTYPDAYPGVDLAYEVQNDGLKEFLILTQPPQAPTVFRFLLGLAGLTAQQGQGDAISLLDPTGETAFTMPPGWMEDSSGPEASRSYDVTHELISPGGQLAVEITPDIAWLQDSARVYPVTIDPATYLEGSQPDTYVDSQNLGDHSTDAALFVGKDGSALRRALLRFDGVDDALGGTIIQRATLNLFTTFVPSGVNCTINWPKVQRVTSGLWPSDVHWNNKPLVSADLASAQACQGQWAVFDVTGTVADWAANGRNFGFQVTAPEHTDSARRRFASNNFGGQNPPIPYLLVDYNSYPFVPTARSPVSGTQSMDRTPTLSAVYNDPDPGDDGLVRFEVEDSSGNLRAADWGNWAQPGGVSSWTVAPPLDCDETYAWYAIANDGAVWSEYSDGMLYTTTLPTLDAPADGARLHTFTPTLTAQDSGAQTYKFVVTSNGNPVATSPWIAGRSWTVPAGALADGGMYEWYAVPDSDDGCPSAPRSFKLDVQRLGARGHFPMVDFTLGHGTGLSVNAANGNLVVSQTDASLPTVDDPFVLSRTYNSRGAGRMVYVEDQLPYNAQVPLGSEPWQWDLTRKWSGGASHTDAKTAGFHQHYFENAEATLYVPYGASLVTYAYLNLTSVPRMVMLQFRTSDNSWEHRAYWGENLATWGTDGTESRRRIGNLPTTGQWVRLEVPAALVGLEGKIVEGIAYSLHDGQAWFDKTYLGGGPAGYGWSLSNEIFFSEHSFTRLIERTDNAHLELVDSYGGNHYYYPTGTPNQYRSESGDFAMVTREVAPETNLEEWKLKNAEGFRYFFNLSTGRLMRIKPPELGGANDKAEFSYAYSGERLTSIKDRIDRQMSFTYDTEGRISQVRADFDTGPALATYEYNPNDELTAVIDANGHRTEYTYNQVTHELLTITTPNGIATEYVGDFRTDIFYQSALPGEEYRRASAIRQLHADGAVTRELMTTFAYTPETRTTKVTSPRGNATHADLNDFVTTFEYNEQLNPVRVTDALGNATVMEWNSENLRTRLVDRENNVWQWAYDGNGNLCRETIPTGAATEHYYDEFAAPYTCSSNTKPTHNLLTRTVDAEGRVTKIEYLNPQGGKPWVTKETLGFGTAVAAATVYEYYEDTVNQPWQYGKLMKKIMPKGNVPSCDSTCRAPYTTTYNYWGLGDVYTLPGSSDPVPQQGWLKSTSQPSDTPITCGGAPATACNHYDRRGNQIHTLDAKGDHYQVYDPDDRLVRSQDLGAVGSPDPARWVVFTYDANGNRIGVADPDFAGDQTAFSYDDLNRLTISKDAWGTTTTYKYDENGNVKEKATTTGGIGTTSYTYDGLDRLQTLTDPQGKVTTYQIYDKEGRLREKRLPNGTRVYSDYNAAGWLSSLRNRRGSLPLADTTYTYDSTGKKRTEILPGSAGTRTYTYDAVGRLTTVVHGSTTRTYLYDENSNRKEFQMTGAAPDTYTYNALDQLTLVSGAAGTQTFTYNTAGELTRHVLPGYVTRSDSKTGTVDAAGATSQSWTFGVTAAGPIQATLNWPESASNLNLELRKQVGSLWTLVAQASTGNRPETLTYQVPSNGTGNYMLKVVAASGSGTYTLDFSHPVANERAYTYDASGLPVTENNNLSSATSLVDGLDRVLQRTERDWKGAVTSNLRYGYEDSDDSRVSETDLGTGALTSYTTDPGGLHSVRKAGATAYHYYNGHGDIVQTANESGTALNPAPLLYDEFGIRPGGPYPYGWTGRQQRDTSAVTGTIRMGMRLYDPRLGRFLSRDPVEGGSLNDYEYAGGDPVNNLDLDGQIFGPLILGLGRLLAKPLVRLAVKVLPVIAKKVVNVVKAAVRPIAKPLSGRGVGIGNVRVAAHGAHSPVPKTLAGGPVDKALWIAKHHRFRPHGHVQVGKHRLDI